MTRFEVLTKKADDLVFQGRAAVPGLREELFREAENIRTIIDNMSAKDAGDVIPACKGNNCTVKNCAACLSKGITS